MKNKTALLLSSILIFAIISCMESGVREVENQYAFTMIPFNIDSVAERYYHDTLKNVIVLNQDSRVNRFQQAADTLHFDFYVSATGLERYSVLTSLLDSAIITIKLEDAAEESEAVSDLLTLYYYKVDVFLPHGTKVKMVRYSR